MTQATLTAPKPSLFRRLFKRKQRTPMTFTDIRKPKEEADVAAPVKNKGGRPRSPLYNYVASYVTENGSYRYYAANTKKEAESLRGTLMVAMRTRGLAVTSKVQHDSSFGDWFVTITKKENSK